MAESTSQGSSRPEESGSDAQVRVILWSAPRCITTAFAKCISAIPGTEIWFEPYAWGHFAQNMFRDQCAGQDELPMEYSGNEDSYRKAADCMSSFGQTPINPVNLSFGNIKQNLEKSSSKHVFVKDMTVSMDTHCKFGDMRGYLPSGYRHTFLIRHPSLLFSSYRKAMVKQLKEIGQLPDGDHHENPVDIDAVDPIMKPSRMFTSCYDLWRYVRENLDSKPIVIDSSDLLSRPQDILRRYCEEVGLPYSDSLLQWNESTDMMASWKTGGEYFYRDVVNFFATAAKSSCFSPPRAPIPTEELPNDVRKLTDASLPLYQEMYETRLQ